MTDVQTRKTLTGLGLLALALAAGLLGDYLLRADWGVGLGVWCLLLVAGIAWIGRDAPTGPDGQRLVLLLIAVAFAFGPAWRSSSTLVALDVLTVLVLVSLATLRPVVARLSRQGVLAYLVAIFTTGLYMAFGGLALVAGDIRWRLIPREGWLRHAVAVARGLAIAVPLLVVFGGLFMAADAAFEGIVNQSLNFKFEDFLGHIFLTGFLAWGVAGYLRGLFFGEDSADARMETAMGILPPIPNSAPAAPGETAVPAAEGLAEADTLAQQREAPAPPAAASIVSPSPLRPSLWPTLSLGVVEITIILGLLDVLFFVFVVVQFRYFFGGNPLVDATSGLTYATYARRGFFELVNVIALAVPMLLAAHWLLRKDKPWHEKLYRGLAGAMVAMLYIIMTSALMRMGLYQNEYGQTETRFYTTAFMGWLGLVLAWFCFTVLRGDRERFAFGALVSGLAVLASLHVVHPDSWIVSSNMVHEHPVVEFDDSYALSLGAGSVPALIRFFPNLGSAKAARVSAHLLGTYTGPVETDWRSWNFDVVRARALVAENLVLLKTNAARDPQWTGKGRPLPSEREDHQD